MTEPDVRDRPLPILSWALYDFANTIFSGIVVTLYLPKYLNELTGQDKFTGMAVLVSMILAGLVVPFVGAVADRTGRTKSYLMGLTVLCCAATGLMSIPRLEAGQTSLGGLLPVMLGFVVANFTYQVSLVFYNSLLPVVASDRRAGTASGLGVGLGYLGLVGAFQVAGWVETHPLLGVRFTFALAGMLFLLFSVPLFLIVPERKVHGPKPISFELIGEQARVVRDTVLSLPRHRPVMLFFLGNFFVVDALNTMIVMFTVYVEKELLFTPTERMHILIALNLSAFVMGIAMGFLTDRLGSKRAMLMAVLCLGGNILLAGLARDKNLLFWSTVFLAAIGVSGVWVAGRKLLLELSPADKVGEYFGLYGLTGKLSSFGTIFYTLISDAVGKRPAMLSQLVTLSIGLYFLTRVVVPPGAAAGDRPGAGPPGES